MMPPSRLRSPCILILLVLVLPLLWAAPALAAEGARFFHSGDGRLYLTSAKNPHVFKGVYRNAQGQYDPKALRAIQAVFDAPADEPQAAISLRLIEFLDFLQDRLKPNAPIKISSGWRSPAYNTHLRESGKLAATASLHQYGMAADIEIKGVSSRKVWQYMRKLGFGGAGFYHGELVHVDVGPARFWDETTSGVGTGISDNNKLIGLVTDFDIYRPGNEVVLRFIRMTAFPIGVAPQWELVRQNVEEQKAILPLQPAFTTRTDPDCPQFGDIVQMMNIRWRLPADLPPGRYFIKAAFCQKQWPEMPENVNTPVFELK
ncbi:MAG: DUF882 domain-containing protein [Desulfobacteraceae bacterium]|nr:DUF882 domain-containing protein [Desulfobacteraceae bacterium]